MLADINQILTPYPWQQNQWQDLVARLEERGDGVDVRSRHGNFGSRFSVNARYPSL